MSPDQKKLLQDALALPERERLQLASELIASVDGEPEDGWQEAWQAEVDRRLDAAEKRGTPAPEWAEVRARVLSQLGRQ
jgi:putative addiction module component (TIGR02574 family)